jgi:hypothetical protein
VITNSTKNIKPQNGEEAKDKKQKQTEKSKKS